MVVLIIFPVILQTDINDIMLSIGGQGDNNNQKWSTKIKKKTSIQTATTVQHIKNTEIT